MSTLRHGGEPGALPLGGALPERAEAGDVRKQRRQRRLLLLDEAAREPLDVGEVDANQLAAVLRVQTPDSRSNGC